MAFTLNKYNDFRYAKVGKGFYFGATDFIFNNNHRKATVIALTDCQLYSLKVKAFKKIFFKRFRDQGIEFIGMANDRSERLLKLRKEAIKVCEKFYGKDYENENSSYSPKKLVIFNFLHSIWRKFLIYSKKKKN